MFSVKYTYFDPFASLRGRKSLINNTPQIPSYKQLICSDSWGREGDGRAPLADGDRLPLLLTRNQNILHLALTCGMKNITRLLPKAPTGPCVRAAAVEARQRPHLLPSRNTKHNV